MELHFSHAKLVNIFKVLYFSQYIIGSHTSTLFTQGYILTSEIDGTIQMKSYLSGNPEIRLALNEDLSIGKSGTSLYGMFLSLPGIIYGQC